MIAPQTVFVLGAGASQPYGFPSGRELVDLVCRRLDGDVRLNSIDLFVERNSDYATLAKRAIALELIA